MARLVVRSLDGKYLTNDRKGPAWTVNADMACVFDSAEDANRMARRLCDADRPEESGKYRLEEWKDVSPLAGIRETVAENNKHGRYSFDGLTSAEIAEYNRFLMFGENDDAFPDQATWSRIVD